MQEKPHRGQKRGHEAGDKSLLPCWKGDTINGESEYY